MTDELHKVFTAGTHRCALPAQTLERISPHLATMGITRAADITGCAIATSLATTTSILRMVAKRHHFSDVLLGVVVGVLSGWLLPALATFGFGGER